MTDDDRRREAVRKGQETRRQLGPRFPRSPGGGAAVRWPVGGGPGLHRLTPSVGRHHPTRDSV